jgi:hypothetical protein
MKIRPNDFHAMLLFKSLVMQRVQNADINRVRSTVKLLKRQFNTKIHFMDICPCLKRTNGLIFSSLVVKRNFIGVSMKISIYKAKEL